MLRSLPTCLVAFNLNAAVSIWWSFLVLLQLHYRPLFMGVCCFCSFKNVKIIMFIKLKLQLRALSSLLKCLFTEWDIMYRFLSSLLPHKHKYTVQTHWKCSPSTCAVWNKLYCSRENWPRGRRGGKVGGNMQNGSSNSIFRNNNSWKTVQPCNMYTE